MFRYDLVVGHGAKIKKCVENQLIVGLSGHMFQPPALVIQPNPFCLEKAFYMDGVFAVEDGRLFIAPDLDGGVVAETNGIRVGGGG